MKKKVCLKQEPQTEPVASKDERAEVFRRKVRSAVPKKESSLSTNKNPSENRTSSRTQKFGSSRCLMNKVMVMDRRARGLPVYDFGLGEAKGEVKESLKEAGKLAFNNQETGYIDPAGLLELRKAILEWLNIGDHYTTDNVVVSVGAKQALMNIFLAVCEAGDVVLFDSAPWVSYIPMAYCSSTVPICIQPGDPGNPLKISGEDLRLAISRYPHAKLFLLNSPCNPTGQIYSEEELEELLSICVENQIFFVLDRLYWKSVYDERTYPEPRIDEETLPWLIQVDGLSKNWRSLGGLRVGWIVAPRDIASPMISAQSHITSGTATTSQMVALEAITEDYDYEMKNDLQKKKDLFQKLASEIPGIKVFPTEGGFYSYWDISGLFGKETLEGKTIKDSDDLSEYLIESAGVATLSGCAFEQNGYLRLCFHVPMEEIEEGLQAARIAIERLSK